MVFDPIPDDPITRGPRRETAVRRLLPCLAERIDLGLLADHAIGPLGGVVPELLLGHGLGPGRLLEGRPEGGGGPGHVLGGGGEKEKEGGRGKETHLATKRLTNMREKMLDKILGTRLRAFAKT